MVLYNGFCQVLCIFISQLNVCLSCRDNRFLCRERKLYYGFMHKESSLIFAAISSGYLTAAAVIPQEDDIKSMHTFSLTLWLPRFASPFPFHSLKKRMAGFSSWWVVMFVTAVKSHCVSPEHANC